MGNLFRGRGAISQGETKIAGFRVQTSAYGLAIPLVYGTARVAGNVLQIEDQGHDAHTSSQSTGKWSKPIKTTSIAYRAALALALCEGPIAGIGAMWIDKDDAVAFAGHGYTLFPGGPTQAAWPYLTTAHAARAVAYPATAYIAHPAWPLADGNGLRSHSWEVRGLLRFDPAAGIVDASPADVALDFLTDPEHGAGFPAARVGDWTDFSTYVRAAGLFCSPVFAAQAAATAALAELADVAGVEFVWSDGLLKAVPYADEPISGNGVTYTPNTAPLYALTEDDLLASGGEPAVRILRGAAADAYNHVRVEYEQRDRVDPSGATVPAYDVAVAEAKDDAAIARVGLRSAPVVKLASIKDASVARHVAQRRVQRSVNVRNVYEFRVGLRHSLLEPMDVVTLTHAGLGLAATGVRIRTFEEDADGSFRVTAEDYPRGSATAARYATASGDGVVTGTGVVPSNTGPATFVEAPLARRVGGVYEIWLGLAGDPATGGANWGGCDVYVSTDGATYTKAASLVGPSTFGVLAAAASAGVADPTVDATTTLDVDLAASRGLLASVPASDLTALRSLLAVDTGAGVEFLAYQTATLTAANRVTLATLRRGLYATAAAAHASGASVLAIDDAIARVTFPGVKLAAGQTLYFKFPAFNQFGNALQDVATVAAQTFAVAAPAANVTGSAGASGVRANASFATRGTSCGAGRAKLLCDVTLPTPLAASQTLVIYANALDGVVVQSYVGNGSTSHYAPTFFLEGFGTSATGYANYAFGWRITDTASGTTLDQGTAELTARDLATYC